MSEQKQDPHSQPLDIVPRPATKALEARPLPYPEVELLRYDGSADLNLL